MKKWLGARRLVQFSVVGLLALPRWNDGFYYGDLASATVLGVRIADPLSVLEIGLASRNLHLPLLLAGGIVVAFYALLHARAFCSWCCPLGLLTEWTETARRRAFGDKGTSGEGPLETKMAVLAFFLLTSAVMGIPLFTSLSPIINLGRFFYFGAGIGSLLFIAGILALDFSASRRLWCRSLCPLGAFYSLFVRFSPLRIGMRYDRCTHCGECLKACVAPEVLKQPLKGTVSAVNGAECVFCVNCVDACPEDALSLTVRGFGPCAGLSAAPAASNSN